MAKGRVTYVPKSALDELEQIKLDRGLLNAGKAFDEMAKYSRAGREIEKIGGIIMPWIMPTNRKNNKER